MSELTGMIPDTVRAPAKQRGRSGCLHAAMHP
jgi:hypothetical protein